VEIKCQLDATEVFIADLISFSTCFGHHYAHHQELKSITQWLFPHINEDARSKSHQKFYQSSLLHYIQGGSNMTGTDLCVNKPHCAAAVRP